ncbi:MAG: ferritin family protein [Candidatus Hecatellaceae archaeon]
MSILRELAEWIGLELYCRDAYRKLASQTDNRYAQGVFQWLSQACGNHAHYLKKTLELLGWQLPEELFKPKRPPRLQTRQYSCDVEEVYWTAKEHLAIEQEMKEAYQKISMKIGDEKAREILEQIVREEEDHYRELSLLVQVFEQTFGELGVEEGLEQVQS